MSPACCSVTSGRPLGQKKQTGSFNERREFLTLSWRERVERSCHGARIQRHWTEEGGAGCVLEGPLSSCHTDSWFVVTGAALPAIRNSPFCEGGLLNHLNEALMDSAEDWTFLSSCSSCRPPSSAAILSEAAGVGVLKGSSAGNRKCLVFGSRSAWATGENQVEGLVLTFRSEPRFPQRGSKLLHDGEPLYQQQLLEALIFTLESLSSGDVLLLPLFSALTRVTAAVVLCLHACFCSVSYRCPPPAAPVGTLLVCVDFCPGAAAQVVPALSDVHSCMSRLLAGEEGAGRTQLSAGERQVLQFVPMEELLSGGLTDFLWSMNSEIIQQKLHLLLQS